LRSRVITPPCGTPCFPDASSNNFRSHKTASSSIAAPPSPARYDVAPCRSRTANQNRSRRSCLPELPLIRAGWERALTCRPVSKRSRLKVCLKDRFRISFNAPWTTLSRMDGIESWRILPPLLVFPLPCLVVDMSAAPTPYQAGQETLRTRCLYGFKRHPSMPELRHSPWLADRLRGESLVYQTCTYKPKAPRRFSLRLDVSLLSGQQTASALSFHPAFLVESTLCTAVSTPVENSPFAGRKIPPKASGRCWKLVSVLPLSLILGSVPRTARSVKGALVLRGVADP